MNHIFFVPVNLDRLIENAQSFFSITRSNVSDLHPCDVIQSVKDLECGSSRSDMSMRHFFFNFCIVFFITKSPAGRTPC